jgi:hypothetical protein
MESQTVIKLAKKIAALLKNESYQDSVKALQMAKIMMPTTAERRKLQKAKEAEAEDSTEGSLVPADEEIMKFSKAMGRPNSETIQPSEVEMPEELE